MFIWFYQKSNRLIFEEFILNDFIRSNTSFDTSLKYDSQISSTAFNKDFFDDIKRIEPFGNSNPLPTFFFKDLKVIKSSILKEKYISSILKSKAGLSINAIFFDSLDSKIADHLLNYKKYFNVIGQINEYFINNKKKLQLIIKDITLWFIIDLINKDFSNKRPQNGPFVYRLGHVVFILERGVRFP